MKKMISMLAFLSFGLAATQSQAAYIIGNDKDPETVIQVVQEGEIIKFSKCSASVLEEGAAGDCTAFGRPNGYQLSELVEKQLELQKKAKRDAWINVGIVGVGVAVGFVAGARAGKPDGGMFGLFFNIVEFGFKTAKYSAMGLAIAAVKGTVFDKNDESAEALALAEAGPEGLLVKVDMKMKNYERDLNRALAQ